MSDAIVYEGRDFTEDEARRLTADIKAWAGTLWVKLKYAHDGKAYKAMGYSTWVDYLRDEFDISKSQGYRLLAHARTMDQLADAAGLYEASPIGDIPEGQTRGIDLRSVADEIADQVHQLPHDATDAERAAIVTKVIEEHRTTTETSTSIDADTGEILSESPTDAPVPPSGEPVDDAPGDPAEGPGAGEQQGLAATSGDPEGSAPSGSSGHLDEDDAPLSPAMQRLKFAGIATRALGTVRERLLPLDPAEVMAAIPTDERDMWASLARDLHAYADRIETALAPNLRSVQ